MQYLFMLESFIKIGMKEDFLNLIKVICGKSVTVITITELSLILIASESLAAFSWLNTSQEILNKKIKGIRKERKNYA